MPIQASSNRNFGYLVPSQVMTTVPVIKYSLSNQEVAENLYGILTGPEDPNSRFSQGPVARSRDSDRVVHNQLGIFASQGDVSYQTYQAVHGARVLREEVSYQPGALPHTDSQTDIMTTNEHNCYFMQNIESVEGSNHLWEQTHGTSLRSRGAIAPNPRWPLHVSSQLSHHLCTTDSFYSHSPTFDELVPLIRPSSTTSEGWAYPTYGATPEE
ncbi:hypothetical protein M408DRAFT_22273 [Serendipita vermifera MAFF 305830]|uniref:Uncharacterized protein n=1 Tax=Serendipita vermifera MAFF 305830 TaxID=933852 RepID=A0A0C3B0G5_SERVB|nr:hypothetical protein M408DRAFT_22273 [Serendipita vermifera MAFF 305830]